MIILDEAYKSYLTLSEAAYILNPAAIALAFSGSMPETNRRFEVRGFSTLPGSPLSARSHLVKPST